VKQLFALWGGRSLLADQKGKTPHEAGFSKMDAWVNDDAASTKYPRQGSSS
jgi:hypothetical protein